jgi:hypothetical protein
VGGAAAGGRGRRWRSAALGIEGSGFGGWGNFPWPPDLEGGSGGGCQTGGGGGVWAEQRATGGGGVACRGGGGGRLGQGLQQGWGGEEPTAGSSVEADLAAASLWAADPAEEVPLELGRGGSAAGASAGVVRKDGEGAAAGGGRMARQRGRRQPLATVEAGGGGGACGEDDAGWRRR